MTGDGRRVVVAVVVVTVTVRMTATMAAMKTTDSEQRWAADCRQCTVRVQR